MPIKLPVLSSLFALAVIVAPQVSAAAMLSPHTMQLGIAVSQQPPVQKVANRCSFWFRECIARWGGRNMGYQRCMWRHGC
jgi:hypothetical protein